MQINNTFALSAATLKHEKQSFTSLYTSMTLVSVIAPALFLLHRELFLVAFLIYCQLDDCPGGVAVVVLQRFL
jgi:hypothetical protein